MLKQTCLKCHWSWSINTESVQAALASLEAGATHYALECPKCRRINKVPVEQLRRALPRNATQAQSKE